MALIVETGTGIANAAAYIDEAAATAVLTLRALNSTIWMAASVAQREAWILRGADLLNDQRRHPWKGSLVTQGQAMQWPRTGIAFPAVLPLCNALYAVNIANGVSFDGVSSSLGSITSVSVGSLAVSFDPAGSAPESDPTATPLVRNPTVDGLLFPYVMLPRDAVIGSNGGVVFSPLADTPSYDV